MEFVYNLRNNAGNIMVGDGNFNHVCKKID